MAIKLYAGDKITGLSTDVKPLNIMDGATFYESDTKKVYLKVSGVWDDVDSLPNQTGQDGKFLTTDGSTASWAEVSSGDGAVYVGAVDTASPYRTYVLFCRLDTSTARKFSGTLFGSRRSGNSSAMRCSLLISDTNTAGNVSYNFIGQYTQSPNLRMVQCTYNSQVWLALEISTNQHEVLNSTGIYAMIEYQGAGIDLQTVNNSQVSSVSAYNSHHQSNISINNNKLTISSTAPSSPEAGDVWIQI